jgi:NADPH:quinone reductase-like Zn-dependent oxidoreductase
MKAIVQHQYGAPQDVLHLAEVEMPVAGAEDILVSVRASSANPWDWHFIRGEPLLVRPAGLGGVRKPKFPVPGGDLAGTVERAGSAVTAFKPGDEVYGFGHGAFAEYIAVDQDSLAPKPGNLTFEQAAAVPLAAVTALQGLRAGGIQPGQHVLIIGASGGVGTFAVQIATYLGAQVTGVCSTPHADLVRRLGAEHVIDDTKQDFTLGAAHYHLALQLGGTYSPAAVRKVLTPHGTLIQSFGDGSRWFGPVGNLIKAVALNALAGQTLKSFTAKVTAQALTEIGDLIESGSITPVIDRTYPLTDAAAAVQLVEEGSPAGKVIVVVEPPPPRLSPRLSHDVQRLNAARHCSRDRVTGGERRIRRSQPPGRAPLDYDQSSDAGDAPRPQANANRRYAWPARWSGLALDAALKE